jgi:hypothetical protein
VALSPTSDPQPLDGLHRYFRDSVQVASIAESLVSFDSEREASGVRDYLRARDFEIVGVRIGGLVAGWARCEDLTSNRCGDHTQLFRSGDVIDFSAPLADLIPHLGEREQMFVRSLGAVAGITTRADLQKPPVRMWLFGLVTVLEDSFLRLLRRRYTEEKWRGLLSKKRLGRAERLQYERRRRNESLDLAACLHFSDKADILLRDEEIRERLGFSSRNSAREVLREVEQLRNQLAHSHDIVTSSLPVIVNLANRLDLIFGLARS